MNERKKRILNQEVTKERIRLALKRTCHYRDLAKSLKIVLQTDGSFRVTSTAVAFGIDFNVTIELHDTLRLWIPGYGTFNQIPYRFRAA